MDTYIYRLYTMWSQTYLPSKPTNQDKIPSLDIIVSRFSSLNLPIDYAFAQELADIFPLRQFNIAFPLIVANVLNVEQQLNVASCMQSMYNHEWLASHLLKTRQDIKNHNINTTGIKEVFNMLYKLSQDMTARISDIREWSNTHPKFLQMVDCCWSPYRAFRYHIKFLYQPDDWHKRLFTKLSARPISDLGYTIDNVADEVVRTWTSFDHNNLKFVKKQIDDSTFVFPAGTWLTADTHQAQARLNRQAPTTVIDSMSQDMLDYAFNITKTQQQVLALFTQQVSHAVSISSKASPKKSEDNHPRKNKHVPSIPGHNKEKPWLSKHKKR